MWPDLPFDPNWVDFGAFLCGIACVARRIWLKRDAAGHSPMTCTSEFAFGIAFFPQLLLLVCVMSSAIIDGLANSSRTSLCIAGSYALGAMWEARRTIGAQPRREVT